MIMPWFIIFKYKCESVPRFQTHGLDAQPTVAGPSGYALDVQPTVAGPSGYALDVQPTVAGPSGYMRSRSDKQSVEEVRIGGAH